MATATARLPSVAATRHAAFEEVHSQTFRIYNRLKAAKLPTAWLAVIAKGDKRWHRTDYGFLKALRRLEIIARLATPELYCGGTPCDDLLWRLLGETISLMDRLDRWLRDQDNHELLWRERLALRRLSPERLREQQQALAKLRHQG